MRKVTIKRAELLEKVIKNRECHRQNFTKAQEGYRQEAIEQLDKALQKARDGKNIQTYFALPPPTDQTADYDAVIEMLRWEVSDTVELEQEAFRNYVLDEWRWTQDWVTSNSVYMAKAKT